MLSEENKLVWLGIILMTVGLMSINTRKDQDYLKIYIYILLALAFFIYFFL